MTVDSGSSSTQPSESSAIEKPVPQWRHGGRRCKVCIHPQRAAVDWELATDADSMTVIAGTYEIPYNALRRHRLRHLTASLLEAAKAEAAARGEVYRSVVDRLRDRAEQLDERIRRCGRDDHASYARLMRAEVERLALEAKLTGEMSNELTVKLTTPTDIEIERLVGQVATNARQEESADAR